MDKQRRLGVALALVGVAGAMGCRPAEREVPRYSHGYLAEPGAVSASGVDGPPAGAVARGGHYGGSIGPVADFQVPNPSVMADGDATYLFVDMEGTVGDTWTMLGIELIDHGVFVWGCWQGPGGADGESAGELEGTLVFQGRRERPDGAIELEIAASFPEGGFLDGVVAYTFVEAGPD